MKRIFATAVAAAAALTLWGQAAEAGSRKRHRHHTHIVVQKDYPAFHPSYLIFGHPAVDKRVAAAGAVTGVGATVGFLALNDWKFFSDLDTRRANGFTTGTAVAATTIGCIAIAPMVATVFAQRELTFREAHTLAADCVLPIIGGLLVNAAYDANPHWEPKKPVPVRVARRVRR